MRAFLLALLTIVALASPARAQLVAPGIGSGCPSGSPSPDGSAISPNNTACILIDAAADTWQFGGVKFPAYPGDTANTQLNFGCGGGCFITDSGILAQNAGGGTTYWETAYTTCGNIWQFYTIDHGFVRSFANAPGSPITPAFADTTLATSYRSLADLLLNAATGNTLTISKQPAGYNCWPEATGINLANLTINFAAGTAFGDVQTSKGILVLNGPPDSGAASGVTLNGGDFRGAIRIGDGAADPTLTNMVVHDGCGAEVTSCILSGAGNGNVVLTNVEAYHGGDSSNPGKDHNVYISADTNTDTAATLHITNLYSHDVLDGGWTLKMRPLCITTQCHVTQSYIVCTSASMANCEQNGVIDMSCGGNYLIDFSTLERGAGGDNWYVLRAIEEPVGVGFCAPRAATNSFTIDHDIIIWDGPSPGATVTNLLCIADHDGSGNCETANVPVGTTCTISNSVIVSDSANGITLVNGAGCTEGVNNRHYANRAAAGVGEAWTATDRFGNPCCAFPYQPTHM